MSAHKSHIRHNTGCKVLSAHFTKIHSLEDMSVTPIEILEKTLSLKEREEREEAWMKKLNSIYPYGLNVRAKTCGIMDSFNEVESSKTVVYCKFDKVAITRHGRGGRQQTTDDTFDAEQFTTDLVRDDLLRLRSHLQKAENLLGAWNRMCILLKNQYWLLKKYCLYFASRVSCHA